MNQSSWEGGHDYGRDSTKLTDRSWRVAMFEDPETNDIVPL